MLLNCARTRGTQGQGFAGNPVHRESLFTSVGGKKWHECTVVLPKMFGFEVKAFKIRVQSF